MRYANLLLTRKNYSKTASILQAQSPEVRCLCGLPGFLCYSNSTITNQFCLEIICCRVSISFDYLIYPYYPAYIG